MGTGRSSFYLIVLTVLLSVSGCLYYFFGVERAAQDERVMYFLKNNEILQRRQLKDLPQAAIPFYGDSLVQGLAVSRANPFLENFGIGHDHSQNLLNRIKKDLQYRHFSKYAVAIGINDLGRGVSVGELYQNILKIAELLTFADAVYVHTVLPVAASRTAASSTNQKVRKINVLLSKLPARYQNVIIVPTYEGLVDHGFLSEEAHIGDGLHLNSTANRKWAELLSAAMMRQPLPIATGTE